MKLSIITINYNDAQGLEATIKSVVHQSFRDFQYIVIDGNSSDGSKEVLNKYRAFLDVAISEPDSGIYNAMNKGAAYAIGEYLMFLNSGDTLYDDTILAQLFELKFNEDIVSSRVLNYSDTDADIQIPPTNVSMYTFVGGSLPHPSSLIKRKLFVDVGGYIEHYKIVSDWCFFMDAVLKYNCSYSTTPLVIVKFNRFGISSNNKEQSKQETADFLNRYYSRFAIDYCPTQEEALSNCIYWILTQQGWLKAIMIFPFKVVNRLLHLRNKLSQRMGSQKVSNFKRETL